MQTIQSLLCEQFRQAILAAYPHLTEIPLEVVRSTQEKFGHYQCNSAMKLAKDLKQSPRAIALSIAEHFQATEMVEKLDVEGPGFINVTLKPSYLSSRIQKMLEDGRLGIDRSQRGHKVVVDFSSPNIAKEMHVGHLRSTIIGDCLARVFEFLGCDVLRLNHVGDWGTAFGMLIAYLKQHEPQVLTGEKPAALGDLVRWYQASKLAFDKDNGFKRASQQEVVQLQSGESGSRRAWEMICAISAQSYQEIYNLLDIKLIERGESFYNPMLAEVVADLEAKGLVAISDGAKCIFLEGFASRDGTTLPLMVQKSDGGYNYDTTDMAAIRHRIQDEKADRIIYVTDQGQSTHFQMIFKAAEKAGYLDPAKVRVDHVGFGLVLGPDGKKFRTRSGEVEKLIDLLQKGIEEAKKILRERDPLLQGEALEKTAQILGLGAIKYADLSSHRQSDYVFSYEKMLKFEGNTAAFIMYSYVRVGGIKRKTGVDINSLIGQAPIALQHPSEIALALHLSQFPEALDQVADELLPNRLTDYLYTLAEKFNAFFRDCRVEGSPEQNSRLLLCEATGRTLKQGLELLGIPTLERM
jgi:arginyl-tRNA synthetase